MIINESDLDLSNSRRFVQFQLWRDCDIGCEFCHNRGIGNKNSKIDNIDFVIDLINNNPTIKKFNEIGIIGGELFGKQLNDSKTKSHFIKLIKTIVNSHFEKVYIGTALLYKDLSSLLETLEIFNNANKIDNVLICTSYDTIYRFKNVNSERLWDTNMRALRYLYPTLKLHVETILTEDFCQRVINDSFNIREFEKEYDCRIDFIEPTINLPNITIDEFNNRLPSFLPKRKTFLTFMRKCKETISDFDWDGFLNPNLHSDLYFVEFNGKPFVFDGRRKKGDLLSEEFNVLLNRSFHYSRYSDVDKKLVDDALIFKESLV